MKPNSRNILHVLLALMDTALPHGVRNHSQTICKAYFSVGFFSRCDVIEAKRFPGSSEREEMITPTLCVCPLLGSMVSISTTQPATVIVVQQPRNHEINLVNLICSISTIVHEHVPRNILHKSPNTRSTSFVVELE